jgi:hypothetical protein
MNALLIPILLTAFPLLSVLGGRCDDVDIVVTSRASLKKDFKGVLKNLNLQVGGNISSCDGIERRIDELGQDLDEKFKAILDTKMNEMLDEKLGIALNRTLDAMLNITKQMDKKLNEVLDARLDALLGNVTEQIHRNGSSPCLPAASCADILHYIPDSPSGYYWIGTNPSSSSLQYCDMTRSCGGVTGGWMRVAYLDMTNSSHQCPSGLTLSNRRCKRGPSGAGCSSVTFRVQTLGYSKVCGRIKAYQSGTTDSFHQSQPLGGNYVDGVSLTHGNPRHHLWTFVASLDETGRASDCPCSNTATAGSATQPPAFVGKDYFCDTGSAGRVGYGVVYNSDPLWDGAGCGPQNTCCSFNNPPWFYKQLPQPTTDNIEMRVCRDESSTNEDILIEAVEIYVQ